MSRPRPHVPDAPATSVEFALLAPPRVTGGAGTDACSAEHTRADGMVRAAVTHFRVTGGMGAGWRILEYEWHAPDPAGLVDAAGRQPGPMQWYMGPAVDSYSDMDDSLRTSRIIHIPCAWAAQCERRAIPAPRPHIASLARGRRGSAEGARTMQGEPVSTSTTARCLAAIVFTTAALGGVGAACVRCRPSSPAPARRAD